MRDSLVGPSSAVLNQAVSMHGRATVSSCSGEVHVSAKCLFKVAADIPGYKALFADAEDHRVLETAQDGTVTRFETELPYRWKFLKVSGLAVLKLSWECHPDRGVVSWKLREPGFFTVFQGSWQITPLDEPKASCPDQVSMLSRSRVELLNMKVQPKLYTPPFVNGHLKRKALDEAEKVWRELVSTARKLQMEELGTLSLTSCLTGTTESDQGSETSLIEIKSEWT